MPMPMMMPHIEDEGLLSRYPFLPQGKEHLKHVLESNGITVEELPEFYAKRNLLHKIIKPEDIANGVFAFLEILDKSTGNIINVDGGIANAFVR